VILISSLVSRDLIVGFCVPFQRREFPTFSDYFANRAAVLRIIDARARARQEKMEAKDIPI
jgi:hypothetical protein